MGVQPQKTDDFFHYYQFRGENSVFCPGCMESCYGSGYIHIHGVGIDDHLL